MFLTPSAPAAGRPAHARKGAAILLALAIGPALLSACKKQEKQPPPPPTVLVAHPLQKQVVDWDDYVGRFTSIDAVDLRPRVSGYLESLHFRDGQRVRKGDLLFIIDPRPYTAALAQAEAQVARARATLNNAEVELKRAQALFEAQAGSQQELETRKAAALQARADLLAAQANQRTAALNVEFTHIRAPLTGRISDRKVAPGNLVTADQTVLTSIVNDDPIRFAFESPETLFLKRQRDHRRAIGDPVDIRLQDETTYRWHGRLEFIDNQLDVNSGIIRGRAVVANPQGTLAPGLFGHMRLPGSAPYTGLLVPDESVTSDQQRQIVMVVGGNGVVQERAVQVGPLLQGLRIVRSGLKPGDVVVISGISRAKPGSKVTAKKSRIEPQPAPAGAPYQEPPAAAATPA